MIEKIKKKNNQEELDLMKEFGEKYVAGMEYIYEKFASVDLLKKGRLICHHTCAVDTENMRNVWKKLENYLVETIMSGNEFF